MSTPAAQTGELTEEEAEAMAEALAGLEENPKPLTMEDLVRDYGVMPPMMAMSACQDNDREARGLTLIQNEDNENNERTHTPDNDLDRIPQGGPIEVSFYLEEDQMPRYNAYLAVRAYHVSASISAAQLDVYHNSDIEYMTNHDKFMEARQKGEIKTHEGDNTRYHISILGSLEGTWREWSITVLEIPLDKLEVGWNTFSIYADDGINIPVDWFQLILDGGSPEAPPEEETEVQPADIQLTFDDFFWHLTASGVNQRFLQTVFYMHIKGDPNEEYTVIIQSYGPWENLFAENIDIYPQINCDRELEARIKDGNPQGVQWSSVEEARAKTWLDTSDTSSDLYKFEGNTSVRTLGPVRSISDMDGDYTIRADLYDSQGNWVATDSITYTLVRYETVWDGFTNMGVVCEYIIPPTMTYTLDNSYLTRDDVNITLTARTVQDGQEVIRVIAPDGSVLQQSGEPVTDGQSGAITYTYAPYTATNDGIYTFEVVWQDADGEEQSTDFPIMINTIDQTGPDIPDTAVTVLEDTAQADVVAAVKAAVSITDADSGVKRVTWDFSDNIAAEPGNKVVTVTAWDNAGNKSERGITVTVTPRPLSLTLDAVSGDDINAGFSLGATLNYTGGKTITDYGFVWGTMQYPTTEICNGKASVGTSIDKGGSFKHTITDAAPGYTYYVRAYVTTADGQTYYSSSQQTFATGASPYGTFTIANNGDSSTFTITRTGGTKGAQTVYYRTVNGSVIADVHFEGVSGRQGAVCGCQETATVTITELEAVGTYNNQPATAYANAGRTYQVEIYRVTGGGTIDGDNGGSSDFAARTIPVNDNYTVGREIFNAYQEVVISGETQHGDYDADNLGWSDDNAIGLAAQDVPVVIDDLIAKSDYWRSVADDISYYFTMRIREQESGYQNIQAAVGGSIDTSFYPYEADNEGDYRDNATDDTFKEMYGDNTFYALDHYPNGSAFYATILEHGGGTKDTSWDDYAFPFQADPNQPDDGRREYTKTGFYDGQQDHFSLPADTEQVTLGFGASGNGSDKWYSSNVTHYFKVNDTHEPQCIGVAAPLGSYRAGDTVTISLIFDEIVDSQNSTGSALGALNIETTWGTFQYAGGADTNILYFTGTIGSDVADGTGLVVNSLNGIESIKDMSEATGNAKLV